MSPILGGASIPNDDVNVENSTDNVGSSFTSSTNSLPPSTEISTSLDEPAAAVPAESPHKSSEVNDDGASGDEEVPESSLPTLVFLANNAYSKFTTTVMSSAMLYNSV